MVEPVANTAEVVFAADLFELEAIKSAAYRLSDQLAVEISPSETAVVCRLQLVPRRRRPTPLSELVAHFRAEVLDHDLRIRARRETAAVRNLILSLAFSKTGLQGD